MNTNTPVKGEVQTPKPWEGAPVTDAMWKRHTEDPHNLEDGETHLRQYYEMASRACQLERENAKLRAALEQTVWHDRPEFPGDPYCVLCGAGQKWAKKHGHQDQCALNSRP